MTENTLKILHEKLSDFENTLKILHEKLSDFEKAKKAAHFAKKECKAVSDQILDIVHAQELDDPDLTSFLIEFEKAIDTNN